MLLQHSVASVLARLWPRLTRSTLEALMVACGVKSGLLCLHVRCASAVVVIRLWPVLARLWPRLTPPTLGALVMACEEKSELQCLLVHWRVAVMVCVVVVVVRWWLSALRCCADHCRPA